MNFFNILAKKRWYVLVLLTSLLWFQIFLMFSAKEELNAGVLRTGGVSTIMALERTGGEIVVPAKGDRSRTRLCILFLLTAILKPAFDSARREPLSTEAVLAYGIWETLIGKELTSLPHSDMILRI